MLLPPLHLLFYLLAIWRIFVFVLWGIFAFVFKHLNGENTAKNAELTLKIGEFVIDRSYAMKFISKRSDAHHFKLSKWNDIKFSVHV